MSFQQNEVIINGSLKGVIPLLALLTAFPALSTDMILPAIPLLAENWNQPISVVNLILVCFFVTYGFSFCSTDPYPIGSVVAALYFLDLEFT